MDGVILCSRQTDKPFLIKENRINIYSIEELAYYLYNNIYFVDRKFFSDELVAFIRNDLNMPALAEKMEKHIRFDNSYSDILLLIIKYSDFYSEDEIKDLEYVITKLGDKSTDERMLLRAETFMEKHKYSHAFEIYDKIIKKADNAKLTDQSNGDMWNNLGKIYVRRFNYDKAMEAFDKSCEFYESDNAKENLILASLCGKNEDKVQEYALKYHINDEKVERLRLRLMEAKKDVISSTEYSKLNDVLIYDGSINLDEYYCKIQRIINNWENAYREDMA